MGIGSSHRSERDASLANIPYQSSLTSHIMETKSKNNSGNSLNTLIHPSTTTTTSSTIPTDMSPNHQLPNLENSIVQEKNHSSLLQHSHHHDSILQFIEIPNRDTLQHFTDYYYSMCVPNDWRVEVYGPTTNASRGGGIVISGTSTLNPPPQTTTTTTNPMNYSNGVTSPMTMMENVNSGVSTCEGNHTGNSNSTTTTTLTTTTASSTLNHSVNVNTSSPALNASSSSQIMNGQKIYFSTYDKNVEKDFIEIYVTFSPNDIEKEAKLAIDDIHQMGQQENHEDDYFGRHSSHSLQNQTHASQTLTTNHLKRMPSSHAIRQGMSQMSQQAGFSRVIEPKIVKGITHVIGKKIQPEKKALYFIMQFRHELLPQKLLYKKIYFIQEGNGIIYCLTLTTTRREPEDVIGYTSVTPSPLLTSRENQSARSARSSSIPAIHIESHTCHSPSNSSSVTPPTTHSKNLSLSVTSVAFESNSSTSNSANSSPNLNGEPTSNNNNNNNNNNNTTLTTVSNSQPNSARKRNSSSGSAPKKTFMKMVTSALSTSAIESDSGDEMTILTGFIPSVLYHSVNSQSMASQQQPQPVLDGGVWSDILVRELFVGKSLKELKRKTSNMDGEGVIIHVPICFIPSLKLETDGEQEIIKHYGISDFGKRKEDYKLLLYHPIQYLSRGPYSTKEEMVENIFVTYVDFVLKHTTTVYEKKNLIEFYWNADVCGNCEKLEEEITLLTMPTEKNSGKLLNFFYERIFKEKVKKSFTLLNEKSMEFSSVMNHQSVDSNLGNHTSIITPQMTMLKAKYLELDGNTYFGNTLKKQCCLVERNFKIWIFTYSSTNNLIASEAFHTILSEIKYTS